MDTHIKKLDYEALQTGREYPAQIDSAEPVTYEFGLIIVQTLTAIARPACW